MKPYLDFGGILGVQGRSISKDKVDWPLVRRTVIQSSSTVYGFRLQQLKKDIGVSCSVLVVYIVVESGRCRILQMVLDNGVEGGMALLGM